MSQGLCILRRKGLFWAGEIHGACQQHFSGNIGNAAETEVEEKIPKYNPVTSARIPGRDKAIWHASTYSRAAEVEALKHLRY